MKIEDNREKMTSFGSTFPGDVFTLDGEYYMSTSGGTARTTTNAVHLVSGILSSFEMDREVQLLNAKVVIE